MHDVDVRWDWWVRRTAFGRGRRFPVGRRAEQFAGPRGDGRTRALARRWVQADRGKRELKFVRSGVAEGDEPVWLNSARLVRGFSAPGQNPLTQGAGCDMSGVGSAAPLGPPAVEPPMLHGHRAA
jgi:hypothetical protein